MANPSNLNDILQRFLDGIETDEDLEALRQGLNSGGLDPHFSQVLQCNLYNALRDCKDSGLESLSAIEHGYTFEAILLNILQITFSITESQTM